MKNNHPKFWSTPTGWAALLLIAAATYFLVFEHGQHVLQFLPYLILLLCPLMHVFMHENHGKHSHGEESHSHSHSVEQDEKEETFQKLSDKNKAYRDGYLEGLKTGREEKAHNKEERNE